MTINQKKFLEEALRLRNWIQYGERSTHHILFPFLTDLNPSPQEVFDACLLAHALFFEKDLSSLAHQQELESIRKSEKYAFIVVFQYSIFEGKNIFALQAYKP